MIPITLGDKGMKLLKIEADIGYFLDDKGGFVTIDKITKDDLLRLVDHALTEEVEFDEYKDEYIKNHAHQIVYKNIFDKLNGLKERKQEFKDQSERLYLQEYEKYREAPLQQSA
jgi:hypothetical protein